MRPPESLVYWIDLTSEESRKADAFMDAMDGTGTRDELGLLPLQRAFADRFYPATSTQLSYARFFYFLPALYEALERKRVPSRIARCYMQSKQEELRDILRINSNLRYRRGARRLPSDVYWSMLSELGLFRLRGLSEGAYLDALDDVHRGSPPWGDEGGASRSRARRSSWDPNRPDPTFLTAAGEIRRRGTTVDLTSSEADDLHRRFKELGPNLLTHLVQRSERGLENAQEWPWMITDAPRDLKPLLPAARELSRFARGATLQYAHRLADKMLKGRRRQKVQKAAEREWNSWYSASSPLRRWDLDAFFDLPLVAAALGPPSRRGLERFVRDWMARFRRVRGVRLLHDDIARSSVQLREEECKVGKSRFRDPLALKAWRFLAAGDDLDGDVAVSSEFQLGFRHRIGMRFAEQIARALPSGRGRR